jgi:hypothetical protein
MTRLVQTIFLVGILAACGSQATRSTNPDVPPEDGRGPDAAGTDGTADVPRVSDGAADTTEPQTYAQCVDEARTAAQESRSGGTPEDQAGAAFLAAVQVCTTPSWSAERNAFAAAINSDYRDAAGRFLAKTISPRAYAAFRADRARKTLQTMGDEALLAEFVIGDQDRDRVPDALDECPDTPQFIATDDAGCPLEADPELSAAECANLMTTWHDATEAEPVEPPPWECFVYEAIDEGAIMYHPKCEGAPSPMMPIPQVQYPDKEGFYLLSQVTNQPEGCPVLYEVQMSAFFQNVSRNWTRKELFAAEDDQDADVAVARFAVGTGHPFPDVNHDVDQEFDRTYRWRARSVNGNGQASDWSDWIAKNCENHSSCLE